MKTFLIVGKAFSGLKEKIIERNDNYVLLQDRLATKYPEKKFHRRIVADFSNRNALLASIEPLRATIDGVIAVYETYVQPAAWIAEYLGLPGLSSEAVDAVTDKHLMRQRFAAYDKSISPDFRVVNNVEDLKKFAESHSFPLILKPANLQKSLLVTKNHDLEELLLNYAKATSQIADVYKRYSPYREPKMIVEEFMTGSIHSVEVFIDKKGEPMALDQVVDYQTGYDIGYEDNFHYSRLLPSELGPEKIVAIRKVAVAGCRALDLKNTPAHVEIILTAEGPKIVEIGARNGGYRERMHELANGLDILGMALDTALGKPVDTRASKNEPVAVLELFPKTPGLFEGIQNEEQLRRLESFNYLSIKQRTGKYAGKSSDGFKMCAVIILHNSIEAQFKKDLELVNSKVFAVTKNSH